MHYELFKQVGAEAASAFNRLLVFPVIYTSLVP